MSQTLRNALTNPSELVADFEDRAFFVRLHRTLTKEVQNARELVALRSPVAIRVNHAGVEWFLKSRLRLSKAIEVPPALAHFRSVHVVTILLLEYCGAPFALAKRQSIERSLKAFGELLESSNAEAWGEFRDDESRKIVSTGVQAVVERFGSEIAIVSAQVRGQRDNAAFLMWRAEIRFLSYMALLDFLVDLREKSRLNTVSLRRRFDSDIEECLIGARRHLLLS